MPEGVSCYVMPMMSRTFASILLIYMKLYLPSITKLRKVSLWFTLSSGTIKKVRMRTDKGTTGLEGFQQLIAPWTYLQA